jgi:hydroxyacylglutathione hydrolase
MNVEVRTFLTGPMQTNTYVVREGSDAWIVDPGGPPDELVAFIRRQELTPTAIVLTHGHGDHIAGVADTQAALGDLSLLCPADDAFMLLDAAANLSAPFGFSVIAPPADQLILPGETLSLGQSLWTVLDTSGHTAGGVSYYCAEAGIVLVGDALFATSIGRTDFPGGNSERLISNIRRNLLSLPEETRVLPGHGPETSIGTETTQNPFLQSPQG